jgi:acyl-CoA reductase-like NAD-dependent aldehyde dehydrogenase
MASIESFYIDGSWRKPADSATERFEVINPASELPIGNLAMGTANDVDHAIDAAARAFPTFSLTNREGRLALLEKIAEIYRRRSEDLANAISQEMGAPIQFSRQAQVGAGLGHLVQPHMRIARDEIFGPVLSIMQYEDEDQAVAIANDTPYGLSSYVSSGDIERARGIARRIRAGMVHINNARGDNAAPFGGYKQSGNGREWGRYGMEEFLEVKSMFGYVPGP